MKFLQIFYLYPPYWQQLYARRPELLGYPYETQLKILEEDAFWAVHLVAPAMEPLGYQSALIYCNVIPLQRRWMLEHAPNLAADPDWMDKTLALQIQAHKPDIVYNIDPINYDSRYFRALPHKPALLVGWRAADWRPDTDWSSYDCMLSSATVCLEEARKRGAGRAEFFLPGFPPALAERIADQGKEFDAVFSGQWTPAHVRRNALVDALAAEFEARGAPDRLGLFISVLQGSVVSDRVNRARREALWGLRMYRGLRSGRVVVNAAIDLADKEPGNMRLFECAGSGAFLLTEAHPGLGRFLEPGREVETFASVEEMLEKIRYYLDHSEEREAIALRGQQRCLTEHGMPGRAARLDALLREMLRNKSPVGQRPGEPHAPPRPNPGPSIEGDLERAELWAAEGRHDEAEELLGRIVVARPENARAWNDLGALRYARGDSREALRCFARALASDPDHPGALENLRLLLAADPVREPA